LKSDTFFITLLLIALVSCTSGEVNEIPSCTVSRRDFENSLYIDGYVEPVRSTTATCPPYIEGVVGFLVEDGTYVKEGETLCIVEVAELQISYDQLKTDLENAKANLNKIHADLNMQYALLDAQVKNNEAETQIALLDSLQLKYASSNQVRIKELELQQVNINKTRFEKKLQALEIIRQSEIKKQELQIRQLENRVRSEKEKLDALTVKAPRDGMAIRTVNPLTRKKLQVGDPVWHMMPLVNLPEFSAMKVKIEAPEIDYKYISMDDSVIFSFDAMPENIAGGKIRMKSPVGQPYKEGSKVKFFDIEASIDSALTMPEPGFTANCRILLKLVKDTLVVPQIAVFEMDTLKVVYVKQKNEFEARPVSLGLSSPKEAIIASGLQGNETIALAKPPDKLVKKTNENEM
jgi:multidrug efflux pump subunit AcrA (membrane-fusion protein)